MPGQIYRGRFAPSPTGPLHFGSLVAAAASYLDARVSGGQWLVRMEDLDAPRNAPGAAGGILRTLEAFGFEWDGAVLFQSSRVEAYRAALEDLKRRGLVFPCGCSRQEAGEDGRYAGTCRGGLPPGRAPRSWRMRVEDAPVEFDDRLLGLRRENLSETCGDFVLLRADGIFAYQLAVVVDDAFQRITDVVRGSDLLGSTARQIYLQRALGADTPRYLHAPVVLGPDGQKLSKQTKAAPVSDATPGPALWRALRFLGQQPPDGLANAEPREIWRWAVKRWSVASIGTRESGRVG
jgi:glutamyl-Q tRNA(Asp) synthetase